MNDGNLAPLLLVLLFCVAALTYLDYWQQRELIALNERVDALETRRRRVKAAPAPTTKRGTPAA